MGALKKQEKTYVLNWSEGGRLSDILLVPQANGHHKAYTILKSSVNAVAGNRNTPLTELEIFAKNAAERARRRKEYRDGKRDRRKLKTNI